MGGSGGGDREALSPVGLQGCLGLKILPATSSWGTSPDPGRSWRQAGVAAL